MIMKHPAVAGKESLVPSAHRLQRKHICEVFHTSEELAAAIALIHFGEGRDD